MDIELSKRMEESNEGIFQMLNEKMQEAKKKGKEVYNLFVGTPDFKPADHIMKAVSEAALIPDNYKYSLGDLPELIEAVQMRFEKRYHVNLEADEITSAYGSQEGIAHIGFALLNPGDIILVPNPGYPIFEIGPSLVDATLVPYELDADNGYLPNLNGFDQELLHKAKAMIVSYPLNPVCKLAPRSFYEELIPWAIKHNIIIIHDNAYSDIVFDGVEGPSIFSIPNAKEIAVEFYSLSKSYNYTGCRMSFLVGNKKIVQAFKKFRSQIDFGTFLPVQYGAIAALTGPDDAIYEQCREYQKRRDALCQGLRSIGWPIEDSEGTMFAWTKIPEGYQDDVEFVMELLDKAGVLCTPGSSFGSLGKGYVRFALTMPVERIKEAVQSIKNSGIIS